MTTIYLIVNIDLALSLDPKKPEDKNAIIVKKLKKEIYQKVLEQIRPEVKDKKAIDRILELAKNDQKSLREHQEDLKKIKSELFSIK